MKKVVVIGGGSGLATLLRGLRDYPLDITAVVTMTDDGASSGRLRRDFGLLPPGDIRKCIAALSENETALTDLFEYRFKKGLGLAGHSLGNLLIGAMKDMTGNFERAVEEISRLLNIKGQVLPATLDNVNLVATFEDGIKIVGESKITKYGYQHKIKQISLTKEIKTNPKVLKAIELADVIFIGPGSLYTSIVPNFLQTKMSKALTETQALRVYICNVSTERGETDGFSAGDHIKVLEKYQVNFDIVLLSSNIFPVGSGDGYVIPVSPNCGGNNHYQLIYADLINEDNPLYHDSTKLGAEAWQIIGKSKQLQKKISTIKVYEK
jgi:uncharacterized cofD-like protein